MGTTALSAIQVTEPADIHVPTLQDFIAITRNAGFARTDRFAVTFTSPSKMSNGPWQARDLSVLCEEVTFPSKTIGTRTLRINALNEQRAHTLDYAGDSITFTFLVDNSWQTRLFFEEWIRLCIGESSANDASPTQPSALREVEFYSNYISGISISALVPVGRPVTSVPVASGLINSLISDAKALATSIANTETARLRKNVFGKSASGVAQALLGNAENLLLAPTKTVVPEPPPAVAEKPVYTIRLHECFPKFIDAQPMSSNTPNQVHRLKVTFAYKYYTTEQQLPEHTN